jgi:hypothetical protein
MSSAPAPVPTPAPAVQMLRCADIQMAEAIQPRVHLDTGTIRTYAEVWEGAVSLKGLVCMRPRAIMALSVGRGPETRRPEASVERPSGPCPASSPLRGKRPGTSAHQRPGTSAQRQRVLRVPRQIAVPTSGTASQASLRKASHGVAAHVTAVSGRHGTAYLSIVGRI